MRRTQGNVYRDNSPGNTSVFCRESKHPTYSGPFRFRRFCISVPIRDVQFDVHIGYLELTVQERRQNVCVCACARTRVQVFRCLHTLPLWCRQKSTVDYLLCCLSFVCLSLPSHPTPMCASLFLSKPSTFHQKLLLRPHGSGL